MSATGERLPDWEAVLSAAARLQQIVPGAVLVGGTAAAIHADHRLSRDADHVMTGLRSRFDEVLAQLEAVAGWRTARTRAPVLILGSLAWNKRQEGACDRGVCSWAGRCGWA